MGLAKIVFWKHQKNKMGEHPIFIRITEDRKSKYINTGLYAKEDDWDTESNLFKLKYRKAEDQYKIRNHQENNKALLRKLSQAQNMIRELDEKDTLISSEQVKNEIVKARELGKISVLTYIDRIVDDKIRIDKIGTATCYKDLKRSLKKFLDKQGISDISFKEVSPAFLKKYELDFRQRKLKDTGISFYMRTFRAVFNTAIEAGVVKKEHYPFDEYRISHLKTKTVKRAINKDEISKLKDINFPENSPLFHARNYFLFSYYNRGINFSDIALLKWDNIKKNRLTYIRLKTNKPYTMELLPPAM